MQLKLVRYSHIILSIVPPEYKFRANNKAAAAAAGVIAIKRAHSRGVSERKTQSLPSSNFFSEFVNCSSYCLHG
jgi:hypothetical protein